MSRQAVYKSFKLRDSFNYNSEIITFKVNQIRRHMPRLGGRKLYFLLKNTIKSKGIKCGRDKFFDILRWEHLLVKPRKSFTRTTQSYHRFKKHPNRIIGLIINKPEQTWVSDITYIRTRQGFMYLSLVTDAYSKKIMGYELSDNLKAESTLKALNMAIGKRKFTNRELIHHSDRGFQYASFNYIKRLESENIKVSMTTKYDPYENAIAERVNGILKAEFYLDRTFKSKKEAKREVKKTIMIYNKIRPHTSCNYLTPEQAHISGNYELKKWNKKYSNKRVLVKVKE